MTSVVRVFNALGLWRTIVVMVAGLLCAGLLLIAVMFGLVPQGHNLRNRLGGVVANDFMFFYPASRLSAEGHAAAAYDRSVLTATAERTIGMPVAELVWPYPPTTSVPLALLGWLPPGRAAGIWIGFHVLSLLLIGRLALGTWLRSPAALFFPGSALALFTGQISPFIALLLSMVVFLHGRRPVGAGVSLGLMVIKPHFAIAPGLVMLRERRLAVTIVAILTVLALVAVSLVWFGVETWRQFFVAAERHATSVLAEVPLSRFVSVFSALHSVDVTPGIALALHGAAALIALVVGFHLWRTSAEPSTQALGLVAATILVTPYALDYDLVLLVLPWLLLIRESLDRPELARRNLWPWVALTLLVPPSYIVPLYTHWSIGGPLLLAILLWMWMRARIPAD